MNNLFRFINNVEKIFLIIVSHTTLSNVLSTALNMVA